MCWSEPNNENQYLAKHVSLLASSYHRWTGRRLIAAHDDVEQARAIWEAPFVVVSHTAKPEPRFNYGNGAALRLFGMSWSEFTMLPSRLSAPPADQHERAQLLAKVARHGFVTGYRGLRIASDGRHFWIEDGVIWNVVDEQGNYRGQAATFARWTMVDT
jgi:hypothetical protein